MSDAQEALVVDARNLCMWARRSKKDYSCKKIEDLLDLINEESTPLLEAKLALECALVALDLGSQKSILFWLESARDLFTLVQPDDAVQQHELQALLFQEQTAIAMAAYQAGDYSQALIQSAKLLEAEQQHGQNTTLLYLKVASYARLPSTKDLNQYAPSEDELTKLAAKGNRRIPIYSSKREETGRKVLSLEILNPRRNSEFKQYLLDSGIAAHMFLVDNFAAVPADNPAEPSENLPLMLRETHVEQWRDSLLSKLEAATFPRDEKWKNPEHFMLALFDYRVFSAYRPVSVDRQTYLPLEKLSKEQLTKTDTMLALTYLNNAIEIRPKLPNSIFTDNVVYSAIGKELHRVTETVEVIDGKNESKEIPHVTDREFKFFPKLMRRIMAEGEYGNPVGTSKTEAWHKEYQTFAKHYEMRSLPEDTRLGRFFMACGVVLTIILRGITVGIDGVIIQPLITSIGVFTKKTLLSSDLKDWLEDPLRSMRAPPHHPRHGWVLLWVLHTSPLLGYRTNDKGEIGLMILAAVLYPVRLVIGIAVACLYAISVILDNLPSAVYAGWIIAAELFHTLLSLDRLAVTGFNYLRHHPSDILPRLAATAQTLLFGASMALLFAAWFGFSLVPMLVAGVIGSGINSGFHLLPQSPWSGTSALAWGVTAALLLVTGIAFGASVALGVPLFTGLLLELNSLVGITAAVLVGSLALGPSWLTYNFAKADSSSSLIKAAEEKSTAVDKIQFAPVTVEQCGTVFLDPSQQQQENCDDEQPEVEAAAASAAQLN